VLATTQWKLPGVDVTVYVEATPSATNETVAAAEPAVTAVGVARAAPGIAAAEAAETTEVVPPPLGVTVKVYDVPFVRPVTVQFCEPVGTVVVFTTVQVALPGVEVTV
jgi:hypothetical protein